VNAPPQYHFSITHSTDYLLLEDGAGAGSKASSSDISSSLSSCATDAACDGWVKVSWVCRPLVAAALFGMDFGATGASTMTTSSSSPSLGSKTAFLRPLTGALAGAFAGAVIMSEVVGQKAVRNHNAA
jgi:hypothetical protein